MILEQGTLLPANILPATLGIPESITILLIVFLCAFIASMFVVGIVKLFVWLVD